LLEKDFEPTRTIVLAFGFDEEVGGLQVSDTILLELGMLSHLCYRQGAQKLSRAMLEKYGENSMALLVDEGGQL
jgi:Gly-Xaa carboxypeptidase